MNTRRSVLLIAVAMAGLWLAAAPVHATRPVGATLSGRITGLPGDYQIVLDGHVYRVRPSSPAADALRNLAVGTVVSATLDGPAGDSRSRIIIVTPRANP